jgi:hypothetical protein
VCCALLWPHPQQRSRLQEIRDNLNARIAEAERQGWLGELKGLQVSLAGPRTNSPRSKDAAGQPLTSPPPTLASARFRWSNDQNLWMTLGEAA